MFQLFERVNNEKDGMAVRYRRGCEMNWRFWLIICLLIVGFSIIISIIHSIKKSLKEKLSETNYNLEKICERLDK